VRSNAGGIAATVVALFLGILVVTQFRSQDVYSRSLQLETPSSLTTLIANLADRNNSLRDEIFELRLRVAAARDSVASGQGSLTESQREIDQLKIFAALSAARGQGIIVKIDGTFDDRAMSDLTNELRNAGAEAISVNDVRVGASSRAALSLLRCAQARALVAGRNYVVPDDIKLLAPTALGHRVVLAPGVAGSVSTGGTTAGVAVVREVLASVPVPLRS